MEQELYELLRLCTVRLSILGEVRGTGFFVAPGLILSCAHVVKDVHSTLHPVEAYWNGRLYSAQITSYQPECDLTVLHIDLTGHPCVLLGAEVNPFDSLYSYGYPSDHAEGDPATFTLEGKAGEQGEQLKLKAGQVRPGLSGAPILNTRTGQVCGLMQLTRDRGSDLGGRAISATTVCEIYPDIVRLQQRFHREDQRWTLLGRLHPVQTAKSLNRQRMLERVHSIWIDGLLKPSLHHAALMTLGLKEQPELVMNPWRLTLQEIYAPASALLPGTRITEIYDGSSHGELLILGEPGSGKTTLLLELARDLLARAQQNDLLPIPIIFNLSSWAAKRLSLSDWLIEELNVKYQVPRKLGQSWVETDQLLLLLDGLDEVAQAHRAGCIDAINAFRSTHGLAPLVVCSRSEEYLAQSRRVLLHTAVIIQPLTRQEIDAYLSSAGEQLEALRTALNHNLSLQEMATTPLLFNVLTLAYAETAVEDLPTADSFVVQQKLVFKTYAQRMLQRRGVHPHYTPQQTLHWLAWLAQQLKLHNQMEFHLERLQPSWLPHWLDLLRFHLLVSLIVGGIVALPVIPFFGLLPNPYPFWWIPIPFGGELLWRVCGILFYVALFVLIASGILVKASIKPAEVIAWSWASVQEHVQNGLLIGYLFYWLAVFSLLVGTPSQLHIPFITPREGILFSLLYLLLLTKHLLRKFRRVFDGLFVVSLLVFVMMELIGALHDPFPGILLSITGTSRPVAITSIIPVSNGWLIGQSLLPFVCFIFLWRAKRPAFLVIGMLFAVLLIIFVKLELYINLPVDYLAHHPRSVLFTERDGELVRLSVDSLRWSIGQVIQQTAQVFLQPQLLCIFIGASGGWLVSFYRGGWSSQILDKHYLRTPNLGIQRSLRNSLLVGISCMLFSGLSIVLLYFLFHVDLGAQVTVLIVVECGIIGGIQKGGYAFVQHYSLRFLLWRAGYLPWNYAHFLNYAAERILLHKVGGGYIFIHKLLLEYFASLEPSSQAARLSPELLHLSG